MKRKLNIFLVFIFMFSFVTFAFSGCNYKEVDGFEGTYNLNLDLLIELDKLNAKPIKDASVRLYKKDGTYNFSFEIFYLDSSNTSTKFEFNGEIESLDNGSQNITYLEYPNREYHYIQQHGDYDFAPDYYSSMILKRDISNVWMIYNKTLEIGVNVSFINAQRKAVSGNIILSFVKSNHENNNGGGSENEQPKLQFEQIKNAYKKVGYTIDPPTNNVDASIADLMEQMRTMYAALGFDFCFIGKNLNDGINFELFMLLGTPTKAEADELAKDLDGGLVFRQKNRDIIVSINLMNKNPNFAPFLEAVDV